MIKTDKMSDIMLKTLNIAVDAVTGKQILPNLDIKQLIAAISKEDQNEVDVLIKFISEINKTFHVSSTLQKRKHLVSIVFCCQLEWVQNLQVKDSLSAMGKHVITFIEQAKTVHDKKIGYLGLSSLVCCCSIDIAYLSVNTLIKDIGCNDRHLIRAALQVIPHLVIVDLVPVLFPIVEKRLTHNSSSVKIQSVIALEAMFRIAPEFILNTKQHVKVLLADRDPDVMSAALPYVSNVIKKKPEDFPKLVNKMLFILKQVVDGNMPISMTRHGISAPWIQIRIIKMITYLKIDQQQLKDLAEIFENILNRSQMSNHVIAFALADQCIDAILHLFTPADPIFQQASSHLSIFMHSKHSNFLVTGLSLLTKMSSIDPKLCSSYQDKIVQCLNHTDLSIQKQTLTLLETLMTAENYQVVSHHMISQLTKTHWPQSFVRSSSEKVSSLVEKFAKSDDWKFETFHLILAAADKNASTAIFNQIVNCVLKARQEVLEKELQRCLGFKKLSCLHFRIVAWELCFFANHCDGTDVNHLIDVVLKLCSALDKDKNFEECLLSVILTVTKLCAISSATHDNILPLICNVAGEFITTSTVVQQRLRELQLFLQNQKVLKMIADRDKTEFDSKMGFLDDFISESKERYQDVETKLPLDVSFSDATTKPLTISVSQKETQIRSASSFVASTLPQKPDVMQESFLSKSISTSEQPEKIWSKKGFSGRKENTKFKPESSKTDLASSLFQSPATLSTPPTLNEALQNLSVIDESSKEDRAMLDMMNDMLMTSQSDSDVTDTASPFRYPKTDG